jgi:hypothetical protein
MKREEFFNRKEIAKSTVKLYKTICESSVPAMNKEVLTAMIQFRNLNGGQLPKDCLSYSKENASTSHYMYHTGTDFWDDIKFIELFYEKKHLGIKKCKYRFNKKDKW